MTKKTGKYTREKVGKPGRGEGKSDKNEQPRPRLPLLSGGGDPTLAERFEEELHRRRDD
jgi:hypothetical protein